MKGSFLYPKTKSPGDLNQSITDLHVNLVVEYLIDNKRKQAYILDLLSQFETNPEIITYRQDVLKDVFSYPKEIKLIFSEYEKLDSIFSQYQNLKYQFGLFRGEVELPNDVLNDSMNDFAQMFLDLLHVYIQLDRIMEEMDVKSEGMKQYKDYVYSKTRNHHFISLKEYFQKFIKYSASYMISVVGDNLFTLQKVELLGSLPSRATFFKKNQNYSQVVNAPLTNSFYQTLYSEARLNLFRKFDDLFLGLFEPLFQYNEELAFLEFGLALHRYYKNAFLDLCFPSIAKTNELCIWGLYDLGLSIKAMKEEDQLVSITPNDCILREHDSGRIIIGANNTGKTVFLRSVGISQILFQAGLCIPAREAQMVIKEQLITFLSTKEIHTKSGGRFEKEVQQVSQLIDAINQNSLVLMNEIFQSTSTESGLEVLYDILEYFTRKEAKWFVVTHLRGIVDKKPQFEQETNCSFSVLTTRTLDGKYFMEEYNSGLTTLKN